MFKKNIKYFVLFILGIMGISCVKPYNPPVLQSGNNYLVVDGFINTGINQQTSITLTRSRNLNDSVTISLPELNASVAIKSNEGNMYSLVSTGNGVYTSSVLNLDNTKIYQLNIITVNGEQYNSEFVSCKQAPPIDSLSWEQRGDVFVYLYTHDPLNSTHYYKWDFIETWQYNSRLTTPYCVVGNKVFVCDKATQIDSCWKNGLSKEILIGSSIALSEDVINKLKLEIVTQNDKRIGVRYSMLVRQIGISPEAYKYWEIVKKNSKDRGGFFDLQPGQLVGNIHSESNPDEFVIGFISAAAPQEQRIFINNKDLTDWPLFENECITMLIPKDPNDFTNYYYTNPFYTLWYYSGGDMVLADKTCIDCRTNNAVNKRPIYW